MDTDEQGQADEVDGTQDAETPTFPSNEDQQSDHERREAERQAQRDEHNARTAGESA